MIIYIDIFVTGQLFWMIFVHPQLPLGQSLQNSNSQSFPNQITVPSSFSECGINLKPQRLEPGGLEELDNIDGHVFTLEITCCI